MSLRTTRQKLQRLLGSPFGRETPPFSQFPIIMQVSPTLCGTRRRGPLGAVSEAGSKSIFAQFMDKGRTRKNISVNNIIKEQGKGMSEEATGGINILNLNKKHLQNEYRRCGTRTQWNTTQP